MQENEKNIYKKMKEKIAVRNHWIVYCLLSTSYDSVLRCTCKVN